MSEQTYKEKLHQPILNPIQVLVLLGIVVFEVVVNILPLLMGMDINPIWLIATMMAGIIGFAITSLLRAAYPEEVVDTRIATAFVNFIKQVIDALFANPDDKSDLRSMLERMMVWCVREWDIIYQEELEAAIEYAKSKLDGTNTIALEAEEIINIIKADNYDAAEAEQKELL